MLSTRGNGAKCITQKDLDKLNDILQDRSTYTAYEIAWFDVADNKG
jgi:hypothetical protein